MKILLSAFACAPQTGSETGAGWMYALHLARQHEVWVLTDESRRAAVESHPGPLPANLHFVFYRPRLLTRVQLGARTAHVIYQGWQLGAWRIAAELDRQVGFDFCWHLTYGVFRQPSWLWRVGKPFVFGPVGGAERAPWRFLQGMSWKEQSREVLRDLFNTLAWLQPGLRATYRHAALVIARTSDTQSVLPAWARSRTVVQQEIGGYTTRVTPESRTGHAGELRILFAGRLLGLKGVQFAVRALAQFRAAGGQGRLTIVGDGPMAPLLRSLVTLLGLSDFVEFLGHRPQAELFALYPQFDVFLFPSLHDSGGNVVLEALSFGLPVICLDLGGPKSFVDATCGVVVSTLGVSADELPVRLADELLALFKAPRRHQTLCAGALARSESLTWEHQIERTLGLVTTHLGLGQTGHQTQ